MMNLNDFQNARCMEVDRKNAGDAARFVAKVNQQVKKLRETTCNNTV